ncbi:MAG: Uma2 family endonuclease [Bacteroidota bacterium]
MSDEQLFSLCQENGEARLERDSDGKIIVTSPTGLFTSDRNSEIIAQLSIWNRARNAGHVLDSNAGFFLPNGTMRSPDAAWVSNEKWALYSKKELANFAKLVPEFIIELKSPFDVIAQLQLKMREWMENGVLLGWLIDPDTEEIYVYEKPEEIRKITGFDSPLSGNPVLSGFELDLCRLRIV